MATQALPAFLAPDRAAPAKTSLARTSLAKIAPARKPALLRRVYDFIIASQTRRAEREIARHLRLRNSRFTDDA